MTGIKKANDGLLAEKTKETRAQLEGYIQTDDLRQVPDLRAYPVVFVGKQEKSLVRVQ